MTLKRPLTALLIALDERMRRNILSGEKCITIREGARDYQPGVAMICCPIDTWCVRVEICDVRHCLISELTPEECRADGFCSIEHAVEELRRFYPNISEDSTVTVIRWQNATGKLVDKYRESIRLTVADRELW